MLIKIPCDWFLTDGILTDVRLGAPLRVMDALRRTGDVQADGPVISRLHSEWVMRRRWIYKTSFPVTALSGERRFLVLEGLSGKWSWRLNGEELAGGGSGRAEAEVTSLLHEGENHVEIAFEPCANDDLVSENGFYGSMYLKNTGLRAIASLRFDCENGAVSAKTKVDAVAAGSLAFRYRLRMGEDMREATVNESVTEGENDFLHTPFEDSVPDGKCEISLELFLEEEREDDARCAMYVSSAEGAMRGFSASDAFGMAYIRRAGGNAVCAPDETRLRNLASDRRLRFSPVSDGFHTARPAFQPMDVLSEMAGETDFLYKKGAIFRLSGLDVHALDDVYALSGDRKDDKEYVIRLSRYMQAVELRKNAEDARRKGESFLLDGVRDHTPMPVSSALFDRSERPRPAYFALSDAWKTEHAYASAPASVSDDGILAVPVYYLCDDASGISTINARAYSLDGRELVSASFPALGGSAEPVGRLLAEMPEDGYVVVRTRVMKNDEAVSVSEILIARDAALISALPETQLLLHDDRVENAGSCAAVGVTVPGADYFGILLPGESVPVSKGKPNQAEGLNTIL